MRKTLLSALKRPKLAQENEKATKLHNTRTWYYLKSMRRRVIKYDDDIVYKIP